MNPSLPGDEQTPKNVKLYQKYLDGVSNSELACWFTYNYDRDSFGYNDHWKMDMDIAEFKKRFEIGDCAE